MTEQQPPVFMYYCTMIGVDDPARQRVLPIDEQNRIEADREIESVYTAFEAFLRGDPSSEKWIVAPEAIEDRIDVKSCLPKPNRNVSNWQQAGLSVVELDQLVDIIYPKIQSDSDEDTNSAVEPENLNLEEDQDTDVIITNDSEELVTYLRVRYEGFAEPGEEIYASDSTYSRLYRVYAGDIVISNINAVHGAIAIVPQELDGSVVTTEYTVCRAKSGVDPRLVWLLLRSPEARSNLILLATGIGRNRVSWDRVAALRLPMPPPETVDRVVDAIRQAEEMERAAKQLREQTFEDLDTILGLDNDEAQAILGAFKPPK